MGTVVATVHDSILVECASHQFDRLKHHPHHWIEEGTYDDFKWNILNSDLPYVVIGMYSTGFAGPMWRALQGAPDREEPIALMGTYVVQPADAVGRNPQGVHYVHADFATVEQRVIEMLLNRPEVKAHESKRKTALAAVRKSAELPA